MNKKKNKFSAAKCAGFRFIYIFWTKGSMKFAFSFAEFSKEKKRRQGLTEVFYTAQRKDFAMQVAQVDNIAFCLSFRVARFYIARDCLCGAHPSYPNANGSTRATLKWFISREMINGGLKVTVERQVTFRTQNASFRIFENAALFKKTSGEKGENKRDNE